MNAEFNWWLLIVGLGVGAGLAWLVLADMGRRREAQAERERLDEIRWIEGALSGGIDGPGIDPLVIEQVLELHERWLDRSDRPTSGGDGAAVGDDAADDRMAAVPATAEGGEPAADELEDEDPGER